MLCYDINDWGADNLTLMCYGKPLHPTTICYKFDTHVSMAIAAIIINSDFCRHLLLKEIE